MYIFVFDDLEISLFLNLFFQSNSCEQTLFLALYKYQVLFPLILLNFFPLCVCQCLYLNTVISTLMTAQGGSFVEFQDFISL